MPKFKVGDKVRILNVGYFSQHGGVGEITTVNKIASDGTVIILTPKGCLYPGLTIPVITREVDCDCGEEEIELVRRKVDVPWKWRDIISVRRQTNG